MNNREHLYEIAKLISLLPGYPPGNCGVHWCYAAEYELLKPEILTLLESEHYKFMWLNVEVSSSYIVNLHFMKEIPLSKMSARTWLGRCLLFLIKLLRKATCKLLALLDPYYEE